jgi:hypothetical protein
MVENTTMRKTILFGLIATFAITLALSGAPVQADSLHGFCATASDCSATSVNGNPVIQFNGSAQFGFYDAGGPVGPGLDEIVILSTTNLGATIPFDFSIGGSSGTSLLSLFSTTPWSSGFLDSYLGISASPQNPFNNYGGPMGIDTTVTGFFVYRAIGTGITLDDQAGELNNPLFTIPGGLGAGDFALDFFLPTGDSKWIGTPNSEALESVGPSTPVPEPSSLCMLGLGVISLLGFARKRFAA